MSFWSLDESSYQTLENTIKDVFGKTTVQINIVDIFNSGFLLYSKLYPTPTITVNTNDSFMLKMMIRRFLKPVIEHEFTHMYGKGKCGYLTINHPRVTPHTLRKDVDDILNDDLSSLINCCNCVIQQKQSHQYLDFEFEKLLYSLKNNPGMLRASVLIRLGYLSVTGKHIGWNKSLGSVKSRIVTDFFDGVILSRAENLFEQICQHDGDKNPFIELSSFCLSLDESISEQKNYLISKEE